MMIVDQQLKNVMNNYSMQEKVWHGCIWGLGFIILNLPFYNLTVGPFVTQNGSLLIASLYALPINMILFYVNVDLMKQRIIKRTDSYVRRCFLLFCTIGTIESSLDCIHFYVAFTAFNRAVFYEIIFSNLLLNFFLFLIPSWLFGAWRTINIVNAKIEQENEREKNTNKNQPEEQVIVTEGKKRHAFQPSDFLFAKSEGNYCDIVFIHRQMTIRISLSALLPLLPDYCVRIHKSYIVNTNHLVNATYDKVKIGEHSLPMGRKYADNIKRLTVIPEN